MISPPQKLSRNSTLANQNKNSPDFHHLSIERAHCLRSRGCFSSTTAHEGPRSPPRANSGCEKATGVRLSGCFARPLSPASRHSLLVVAERTSIDRHLSMMDQSNDVSSRRHFRGRRRMRYIATGNSSEAMSRRRRQRSYRHSRRKD